MRQFVTLKFTALVFAALLSTSQAFASGQIYCKSVEGGEMTIFNAADQDGLFGCADHLKGGYACFTGSRAEVIELLNSGLFRWNDEQLSGAHFKGFREVSYVLTSDRAEIAETLSMDRCSRNFFKSKHIGPVIYKD